MNKEIKELQRLARKRGWTVEPTKGGHMKWTPPKGRFIIGSCTPRHLYYLRADLRRAGLPV